MKKLFIGMLAIWALCLPASSQSPAPHVAGHPSARATPRHGPSAPDVALAKLKAGNHRFVINKPVGSLNTGDARRRKILAKQAPFVAILGCADSRVAPELVFDQGLGELFVIRVAGSSAADSNNAVVGTLEYAVEHLDIPLVIVMGHSGCGAVKAAVENIQFNTKIRGSLGGLVTAIGPAVKASMADRHNPRPLLDRAVEANVIIEVQRLERNPVIHHKIQTGKARVVGAVYHLDTGEVQWLP